MNAETQVFVHPKGLCESRAVGSGTRVWAFAHVMDGATIGSDCNVCDHSFVEAGAHVGSRVTIKNAVLIWDGVTLEDDVFVGPGTVFTNDLRPRAFRDRSLLRLAPTHVRKGATIGANATVLCGTTIGAYAFVAAGAVVTANVPSHALVAGSPARRVGWVCECGERLDEELICSCGQRYVMDAKGEDIAPARGNFPVA